MRVLRVPIEVSDYQTISLPTSPEILHVAPSRSGDQRLDLWYLVPDLNRTQRPVGIYVVGTGNQMPDELDRFTDYLGTCVMTSGLVWHVFMGPVQA